jgi:hypothetical protein
MRSNRTISTPGAPAFLLHAHILTIATAARLPAFRLLTTFKYTTFTSRRHPTLHATLVVYFQIILVLEDDDATLLVQTLFLDSYQFLECAEN